ncbi:uncharacterized protein LOC121873047 [Homarus americanus]|uniref:uncharacterized protein LOC121873047 n=1 Tax=Homarus americanus TaxID=6706 RepID=UPI001C46B493|nr:uncharacterized protein LOC121873047 [Homarus americanus]
MGNHRTLGTREWAWVCVGVFLFLLATAAAQLDNENSILGVYMESGMVQGRRIPTQELVEQVVTESSGAMTQGSLTVQFLTSMNDSMPEEMTGVMTLASCSNTHMWAPGLAEMGKMHIALTEKGIEPDPENVKAVTDCKPPTIVKTHSDECQKAFEMLKQA